MAEEPSKLLVWLYYRWRFTATRLSGRGSGSALFTPERPLMGYSAWRICHELGLRIVTEPDEHCRVALNWEDVTVNMVQPPTPPNGLRLLNARCVDIRKSTVEAASIATLGYGLAVDPRTHTGPFVRKSEENGLHDGAVVEGPRDPEPGYIDQRLLDNVVDGRAEDFRVTVVGRQTPMIVRRLHKLAERFDTVEIEEQVSAGSLLAPDEVEKLFDFCERIGLDYGDLDVIRDRGDGRLYVLDANKTPWGPPIRLGFRFSVRFHRRLARMFADEFLASPAAEPAGEASG